MPFLFPRTSFTFPHSQTKNRKKVVYFQKNQLWPNLAKIELQRLILTFRVKFRKGLILAFARGDFLIQLKLSFCSNFKF